MKTDEKSARYQQLKHRLFFIQFCFNLVFLACFAFSGLSVYLRNYARYLASSVLISNSIYLLIFSVTLQVVTFPLTFFEEFIWEHKFNLSNQNFFAWIKDFFKKAFLGFVVLLLMVEAVYFFLGRYPQWWWLQAALFYLFVTFFLAKITPNVIVPLFFKYIPLQNSELKKNIFQLFKKANVALKDIYVINLSAKTKKANAFICGVGDTRRVVLSDTLVRDFSHPEIETVVAHELGHYKHRDIVKLMTINAVVVLAGFFVMDKLLKNSLPLLGLHRIDDIAFFPMIVITFSILGLMMMPLTNGYSRWIERKADQFSLTLTQKPEDFISMIRKLGEMNLAEFKPSWLNEMIFYDHPPIAERIRFAECFVKKV